MARESPPRLKDGPLGPILRAADAAITPERIARNGAAVKSAIAAGVSLGSSLTSVWKLGLPLLLVLGIGLGVRQVAIVDGEHAIAQPALGVAATELAPIELASRAIAYEPAIAEPPPPPAVRAVIVHRVEPPAPPPPPPPAPPPASELPEQIRLYEAAREAAAHGQLADALDRIAELLRRFPSTPLRADAELTRAELWVRADRLAEAAAALEALASDPSHRGRRGELLRTLGDVRRKQADCARAVDAYTRARAERLSAAEQAKVARGLERCANKP